MGASADVSQGSHPRMTLIASADVCLERRSWRIRNDGGCMPGRTTNDDQGVKNGCMPRRYPSMNRIAMGDVRRDGRAGRIRIESADV